jgi:hypothetical protein
MGIDKRERIIENLAVASALGFLVLVMAALSLASDARAGALERAALSPADATRASLAGRADDPNFRRFYSLRGDTGISFATVISLRSPSGSALVGVRFSAKGELQELRFLGSCAARSPTEASGIADAYPGAEAAIARASAFARELAASAAGRGS